MVLGRPLFAVLLALMAAGEAVALADGQPGPECAAVPFSGAPAYVEGRTAGGALSPSGSHFGLKAILDPDEASGGSRAGAMAVLDARTGRTGRLTTLWLRAGGEGRSVHFEPWGWQEQAQGDPVRTELTVLWLDRDVFAIFESLQNTGMEPVDVQTALWLIGEATQGAGAQGDPVAVALTQAAALSIELIGGSLSTIAADDGVIELRFAMQSIAPGETVLLPLVIGLGDDAAGAALRRQVGAGVLQRAGGEPDELWQTRSLELEATVHEALCVQDATERDLALQRLAVAALQQSAYAPRGLLSRPALSEAKSRENGFSGSDLPRQAAAIASFDPVLAVDAIVTQLQAVAPDSHVPYRFDDSLERDPLPEGSLPPVQAQALLEVLGHGGELDDDGLEDAVRTLTAIAAWWPTNRDYRREGLLVHGSHEESGLPDSVRWAPYEAQFYEAPDLNADYLEFLQAMRDLEELRGQNDDALYDRIEQLTRDIDEDLWDEDLGLYVDLDTRTLESSPIVTPHVLWPLAAGVPRDEERVRRAIELTLLEPDSLLGDDERFPIPEVAYDQSTFSPAAAAVQLESVLAALRVLSRYGYRPEAQALRERTLRMVDARPEGIYDRYLLPGDSGEGTKPVFQSGRGAAALLHILHGDYERERAVMPGDSVLEGIVERARFLEDGERLLEVSAEGRRLPRVRMETLDGTSFVLRQPVRLMLSPTCDVPSGTVVNVTLPALAPLRWTEDDGGSGRSAGSFPMRVGATVTVRSLAVRGGGCACCEAQPHDATVGLVLLVVGLAVRTRRK